MIRVEHLYKSFDGKEILKDVSCDFYKGKTNLIIGTSGSGKTVFLKCMLGLIKPDSGKIFFENEELNSMDEAELKNLRTRMGMLFQGSALFDSKTVEQNVMFPLDMFTKKTHKEKKREVDAVLARVNLVDANKKYPSEISGGMMKRVALARAIVLQPQYLFCDEPNSGLDPQTSIVIDNLIKEITIERQITTVINTHDMNTVMESGDNIVFLSKGVKEWQGSNRDILYSTNEKLNNFIFASDFLRQAKESMIEKDEADKRAGKKE